jgi:RNA polymerase sigma-70 factor (ECF subfamily)
VSAELGFGRADPARGRFRGFLMACLRDFVATQHRSAHRVKRGGRATIVPLDFESAEGEFLRAEVPAQESVEEFFEREWMCHLLGMSVDRLRDECQAEKRETHFRLFERFDLSEAVIRPTYEQLAQEFGIAKTDVANYLFAVRRRLRDVVLDCLRELTSDEEDFQQEARLFLRLAPDRDRHE